MNTRTYIVLLALWPCSHLSAADLKILAGMPSTTSRTVFYHKTDIVPIATEIRYTTLIELPKEESIVEVTCGDKEYWPVNWSRNLAYIKPAKQGSSTDIDLIAASGNVYSFLVSEISERAGAHADLKVFVRPAYQSAVVAMSGKPQFVSADTAEGYKKAAEQAKQELQSARSAERKQLKKAEAELRATYPETIRHDYRYTAGKKNPFHVRAIYHDDRFTYIEARPSEAPSVYEIKDGKPSLIQYRFDEKSGLYIIPKILDDGYLRIGKRKLKFHREANG